MAGLLAQVLVSGLAIGAIYALIATGFSLLWQGSQTVNFAQGDFVVVPAFVMLGVRGLGLPLWVGVLAALAVACLVLGVLFKRVLVDPMLKHGSLQLAIATMALSIVIQNGLLKAAGGEAFPFPGINGGFDWGPLFLDWQSLIVLAVAVAAVVALNLFLGRTRIGRAIQASAQNPQVAVLLGIDVARMILITFLINAALVTLAALLISPIYLVKFNNGIGIGLSAFSAAIIGGFNQVRGAVVGGLVLGVTETVAATFGPDQYRDAVPMLLLILFVLFRPEGILGRREERRV
ncbi:MAG: branched-chain amino acid ABC transporter permease [Rhodospirillales bacterium]|nr:branched-chain amino acid ABC transporter permease [Rhodospirillales bacterium]